MEYSIVVLADGGLRPDGHGVDFLIREVMNKRVTEISKPVVAQGADTEVLWTAAKHHPETEDNHESREERYS